MGAGEKEGVCRGLKAGQVWVWHVSLVLTFSWRKPLYVALCNCSHSGGRRSIWRKYWFCKRYLPKDRLKKNERGRRVISLCVKALKRFVLSFGDALKICTTNWVASTLKMGCLTFLEARSPGSRCGQGWFLPRAARDNLVHAPLLAPGGLLAVFGVPGLWKRRPHLCLLHMVFSLCVSRCVETSSFYKDTSPIGLGLTLMISSL